MNALTTISPIPTFSMGDIERVALAIAKGGLFGSSDPNAVLTLCLLAQAEGQHPAVVFRDYHIIQGKPAKKAEAMLRDFISSGGKVEWHALTDEIADATFSHPSGGTIRIDWTLKRAAQAGISTAMWKKYPRQMLRSRVISEGVRSVCPSATSGLYEVDEVRDIVAQQPVDGGVIENEAPVEKWSEPDSIYSGIHKLKGGLRDLTRELAGCGDSDMVYALCNTDEWREFARVAELHAPHYLRGGEPAPEEFEGLLTAAERMVAEFDTAQANGMAENGRAG